MKPPRVYVVCPACGRSEQIDKLLERAEEVARGGTFWSLQTLAGLGRPTREEKAAADAAGLRHAPGHGFKHIVERDLPPVARVVAELVRRCKAFLKRTKEDR